MAQQHIHVSEDGILVFNNETYRCALGKSGVTRDKKEGDSATPVGCFPIREIFYRKDKIGEQVFPFVTHVTTREDAWCDVVDDEHYNKHIKTDEPTTESLWRDDDVYDVVVVLGYNDDPAVAWKGSAIFMHVAREGYTGTAGCIALALEDLLEILKNATSETCVCIAQKTPA